MAFWSSSRISRLPETSRYEVATSGTTPTPRSRSSRETSLRPRRRLGRGDGSDRTARRSRRHRALGRLEETDHLVDRDLHLLALELLLFEAPAVELFSDGQVGVLSDHHHHRLGDRAFQAAGGIHGVAE